MVHPDDGHNFGCEEVLVARQYFGVAFCFFGRVERTSPGQTFSPIEVTNASKRRRQRFRAAGRGSSSWKYLLEFVSFVFDVGYGVQSRHAARHVRIPDVATFILGQPSRPS